MMKAIDSFNIDSEEGPGIEEDLLLKFLIQRGEEFLSKSPPSHRSLWWLLIDIVASLDEDFQDRLGEIREKASRTTVSEILPVLGELRNTGLEDIPISRDLTEDRRLLDERDYRKVLKYVWIEGRKQLDAENFEFINVWAFLGWIGLTYCPERLKEFEELLQSELPQKELLEQGHHLIRDTLFRGPRRIILKNAENDTGAE